MNPLLEKFDACYGAAPFDRIAKDHYLPALEEAIRLARSGIGAITADPAPPDFANTIEALEVSDELVDQVSAIFFSLLGTEADDEMHELARRISPLCAEYANDVTLNRPLFERIQAVHGTRLLQPLDEERHELLERVYRRFVRNGALLDDAGKARLREIDRELSGIAPRFNENVLKATNQFELVVTDEQDLSGLPPTAIEAAADEARARGRADGTWVFTLHAPSYIPFITFSDRAELRERLWRAYGARAFLDDFDNRAHVLRIAKLRQERANLLGYPTHADFVLEERMAQNPETLRAFYDRLHPIYHAAAEKDLRELTAFRAELEGPGCPERIEPWDFAYYAEKLKKRKFEIDQEELRPYFPLSGVTAGVFEHARRLFGIEFTEAEGIPKYHPDVRVFEVLQGETGEHLGLLYLDFFPRKGKQNGAWMTTFRGQGLWRGKVCRPHVSIVCNFTKPTATRPSLLTFDEVNTYFHEFGHALHALLSRCRYRSLSGTNVFWDFVELPSQIMENWIREEESLDLFARHYLTGEMMPNPYKLRIKESDRFFKGSFSLRQLLLGSLDLGWHAEDPTAIEDVDAHETQVTAPYRVLPKIAGTNVSCSFTHIFGGGYSAGYYSYKWAEVLEADAFELFLDRGIFDREIAERFRVHILEKGGTVHPMTLFMRFRGRAPDPEALLKREGLLA